jgi:hypothetical protein
MKVSMDGLRKSATQEMNELGEFIKSISPQIEHAIDIDQLNDAFNNAAQFVDSFNCIFDASDTDDFNDLSGEIGIDRLGDE